MSNCLSWGKSLLVALSLSIALGAFAQEEEEEQPPAATPPAAAPQSKEEQIKAYDAAIKDLPKTVGAFTFYQRKKEVLVELKEVGFRQAFPHSGDLGDGR